MAIDRPNAVESERELLTACFKGEGRSFNPSDVIQKVTAETTVDMYAHDHYRKIYVALMSAVQDAGTTEVDWGMVKSHIHEESMARTTLRDMLTDVKLPPISASWTDRHIKKIAKMSVSRRILKNIDNVKTMALAGDSDNALIELLDGAFSISRSANSNGAQPLSYYMPQIHEEVRIRRLNKGTVGLATGLAPIDEGFGGLQKKHLYYIGGRPGMRKSVVCGQTAYNVAENGYRVLMASPEMSAEQYAMRLACRICDLDYNMYNKGVYNEKQEAAIHDALDKLNHENIIINEMGEQSIATLQQDLIRFKPDLLILDYMQLFMPSRPKYAEYADTTMLSKELNSLKKDFNIPILAAAQLSRKVEEREDKRPIKSDLRATGQIEQDADGIFMLYSEREYATEDEAGIWRIGDREINPNTLEFVCAKNRSGSREDFMTYVKPGEMFIRNNEDW